MQHGERIWYNTPDKAILLGVRYERLYRLLGQLVFGSSGFLDSELVSVSVANSCDALSISVRNSIGMR